MNLVAVGVLMLRRSQRADNPAEAAGTTAPTVDQQSAMSRPGAGTGPPAGAATSRATTTAGPVSPADPQLALTQTPPSARPASRADVAGNPLAAEVSADAASPGIDPGFAQSAARVPDGPRAVTSGPTAKRGSVVYATVPEANDAPYSDAPYTPGTAASAAPAPQAMPRADELIGRGTVPPLHLDLHVYANATQQRFIFVNSRKYKEGDTLQEGPVIEEITPDGAVLNFRGSRFKLTRD